MITPEHHNNLRKKIGPVVNSTEHVTIHHNEEERGTVRMKYLISHP